MSEPRDYPSGPGLRKHLLHGAVLELISAESSLHMPPDPIEEPKLNNNGFLTDLDYGVAHSLEHIRKSVELIDQFLKETKEVNP